jgi:TatD DNase family protein
MKYDIHCHLTGYTYCDAKSIIKECEKKKISLIINGLNVLDNLKVLKLSKLSSNIHASIGMHPTDMFDSGFISQVIKNKNSIVSIGEVGLDYKERIDNSQRIIFKKIINLANKINKPLIVHSRNAEKEVLEDLKSSKVPIILHCFSGKRSLIHEALANPLIYFSIPASCEYSEQFQELIKLVSIEKLFCETDSPYLWKYELNTPLNISHSYEMIAKLKSLKLKDCEQIIENNVNKVFKITEFKNN